MREYEQPKMPANWSGEAKKFYLGLVDVLDELHMPVQESWLSEKLKDRLKGNDSVSEDYSYDEKPTGISFVTGKPIYRQTQEIDVSAHIITESNAIPSLGYVMKFEGFGVTSTGRQLHVGDELICRKTGAGEKFQIQTDTACKAYITVYYTKDDDTPVDEPSVIFDNGWVEGYTWAYNTPVPHIGNNQYIGYSFDYVQSKGYMLLYSDQYTDGVTHEPINKYAYLSCLVTVPANCRRLHVEAVGAGKNPKMSVGFVESSASLSSDYTGNSMPYTTLTYIKDDYAFDVTEVQGREVYLIINLMGYSDARRDIRIHKVYFE